MITIITVVYNGEAHLEDAILSVLNQKDCSFEYIIVDGASDDGTVEIIRKYQSQIDKWVSEPDGGIFDAMNKGIQMANGDIIGIVNSDDVLNDGMLAKVAHLFMNEDIDFVYGNVERINKSGEVYGRIHSLDEQELHTKKYKQIPFPHPSMYIKKECFSSLGLYDTSFRLNADYDFILRLLNSSLSGKKLHESIVKYRDGGASSGYTTFIERKKVFQKHGMPKIKSEWYALHSIIKLWLYNTLPKAMVRYVKKTRPHSLQELQ